LTLMSDILFGVVFSLLFIGVRQYSLRVGLSLIAPIVIDWLASLPISHASYQPWNNPPLFRAVVGGFIGAHLRFLWLWIKRSLV